MAGFSDTRLGCKPLGSVRLSVLVVDDYRDAAETLAELIGLSGHIAYTALDGESALTAAEQLRPDVLLTELRLPRVSGFELCRRLRREHWANQTRIVAVTGWGGPSDVAQCHETGFDDLLMKPIDCAALEQILRRRTQSKPVMSLTEVALVAPPRRSAALTLLR